MLFCGYTFVNDKLLGNVQVLGALFPAMTHVPARINVDEAVVLEMVLDGDAPVRSIDETRHQKRRLRHGLHSSHRHHVTISGSHRLTSQHDRLHPGGANLPERGKCLVG